MRLLLVVPLLVVGLLWSGPGVAGACACGAVITDERLEGVEETALVELGDGRESVTLNIGGRTDADEVAFIMPVPARASFELADSAVFGELDLFSAPRVEYREVVIEGDGAGGGAPEEPGVTVTDHVEVGPFEVAQLAGADSGAVADWLGQNDFVLSQELGGALTPYLADGWQVVAVRLTPDGVEGFADGLPAMRLSFATGTPVYPMRLSATAEYAQPLRLYVLGDQRMDVSNPAPAGPAPELTFAGWVRPADLTDYPALAGLVSGRRFLTRYDAHPVPGEITEDISFTRARSDETYRAVVVRTRYVEGMPVSIVLGLIGAGALVLAGAGAVARLRRRRPRPRG